MQEITLGELISEKRRERHMTQAALAAYFDISDKAVSKWERNLSRPEGNHMVQLVELLDLPRGYMLEEKKTAEMEYLPPQCEHSSTATSSVLQHRHLSAHDMICMVATAVLLALSVSTSSGFLTVEASVPIMGACNALLAWQMMWGKD